MTDSIAPDQVGTSMSAQEEIEVTFKVKVDPRAMFLANAGADVAEGPNKGTSLLSNVASGHPIVYVRRDGKSVATAWITAQDFLAAIIPAVEEHMAKRDVSGG